MPKDEDQVSDSDVEAIASELELEPAGNEPEKSVEGDKPESKDEKPAEGDKPAGEEKPEGDKPAEKPEGEQPEGGQTDGDKPEDKPQLSEEEIKERNRQFYEQRQAARQQQQRAVEQTVGNIYRPKSVDELAQKYLDQGYDEFQATMLARDERREQQAQINEASTAISELNMQIETESLQVMHDFPVFDPNSPEYDKDFAGKASALYQRAANVVTDPNTGLIVQTSITPYEFYKNLSDMRSSGVAKATMQGQKAAEQQMASVTPPPSNAPVVHQSKEDKQAEDLEAALNSVR